MKSHKLGVENMCELKVDRSFLEEAEIVTRETGLTPRQLLDQRDKLLHLIVTGKLRSTFNSHIFSTPNLCDFIFKI